MKAKTFKELLVGQEFKKNPEYVTVYRKESEESYSYDDSWPGAPGTRPRVLSSGGVIGESTVHVPRTIAFVGHGRHGKDEACRMYAEITGGTNAGTLSQYLVTVLPEYVAAVGLGCVNPQCRSGWIETRVRNYQSDDYSTSRHRCDSCGGKGVYSSDLSFENRHENRALWRAAGDWCRREDPARLVKEALRRGNITGGIRGKPEIRASRPLLDLIVWVERPGFPTDPTMEYGREEADLILLNDGTLDDFRNKLQRLWEGVR